MSALLSTPIDCMYICCAAATEVHIQKPTNNALNVYACTIEPRRIHKKKPTRRVNQRTFDWLEKRPNGDLNALIKQIKWFFFVCCEGVKRHLFCTWTLYIANRTGGLCVVKIYILYVLLSRIYIYAYRWNDTRKWIQLNILGKCNESCYGVVRLSIYIGVANLWHLSRFFCWKGLGGTDWRTQIVLYFW